MCLLIEFVYLPRVFCSVPITPCNTTSTAEGEFLPFLIFFGLPFFCTFIDGILLYFAAGSFGWADGVYLEEARRAWEGVLVWTISMYDN